jgi:cytochrome-b5 reductase
MPDAAGHFDLLVKEYAAPAGGISRSLCDLAIGETADMWIKPSKDIYQPNKWDHVALVAAGTGLAPLYQLAISVLNSPLDQTKLSLIFANRHEEDILLREELEALATKYPERFSAFFTLSKPPSTWQGGRGWIDASMVRDNLPPPSATMKVFVCGTDGFLETVCGPKVRVEGQHAKIQGPTTGVLGDVGFDAEMVHKL